jgi:hypothetical protein
MNGIGGMMGPEFNVPKNLTEYWAEKDIIAFARNPSGYRYNSRTPPLSAELNDIAMKRIIDYIAYMKDYKVKEVAPMFSHP